MADTLKGLYTAVMGQVASGERLPANTDNLTKLSSLASPEYFITSIT
ncbi:hypothetical protein GPLA_2020 [Paraglaciecola polaris LMG 21857]|uniref:Uncharacterized protein n=1 Tax=Paraglaciecola polaris LMG 21857 TaxID=1129793 RepID=K6Z9X3_9ALTE|nr:hypothetical protein GPLA_2020 [Paraglaciecola polaris LMG 21857]